MNIDQARKAAEQVRDYADYTINKAEQSNEPVVVGQARLLRVMAEDLLAALDELGESFGL